MTASMDVSDHKSSLSLDDDDTAISTVDLISKEGTRFTVDRHTASLSKLIQRSLEDPDCKELNVDVPGDILTLIIEYLDHQKGIPGQIVPFPLETQLLQPVLKDPWAYQFMLRFWNTAKNKRILYAVIDRANYLDIECLMRLGCVWISSKILYKDVTEAVIHPILLKDEEPEDPNKYRFFDKPKSEEEKKKEKEEEETDEEEEEDDDDGDQEDVGEIEDVEDVDNDQNDDSSSVAMEE